MDIFMKSCRLDSTYTLKITHLRRDLEVQWFLKPWPKLNFVQITDSLCFTFTWLKFQTELVQINPFLFKNFESSQVRLLFFHFQCKKLKLMRHFIRQAYRQQKLKDVQLKGVEVVNSFPKSPLPRLKSIVLFYNAVN